MPGEPNSVHQRGVCSLL